MTGDADASVIPPFEVNLIDSASVPRLTRSRSPTALE